MLSALAVRPPSLSAGPIGQRGGHLVGLRVDALQRLGVGLVLLAADRHPDAAERLRRDPSTDAAPVSTSVTTVLVFGSSRPTRFFRPLVTHTASLVTTCQSGFPGTGNTASGLMAAMSRFTPGVATPGRGGRAGRARLRLSRWAGDRSGGGGAGACASSAAPSSSAQHRRWQRHRRFTFKFPPARLRSARSGGSPASSASAGRPPRT